MPLSSMMGLVERYLIRAHDNLAMRNSDRLDSPHVTGGRVGEFFFKKSPIEVVLGQSCSPLTTRNIHPFLFFFFTNHPPVSSTVRDGCSCCFSQRAAPDRWNF